jgi:hypothetical protein
MRVQAAPELLTRLIAKVIKETALQSGCRIIVSSLSAFQPLAFSLQP